MKMQRKILKKEMGNIDNLRKSVATLEKTARKQNDKDYTLRKQKYKNILVFGLPEEENESTELVEANRS